MGYYSDVALCLTAKAEENFQKAIAAISDEDVRAHVGFLIDFCDRCSTAAETSAKVYFWENIKFYEEDPGVIFLKEFLRALNPEDYRFIRIGEDYEDIEIEGGFYENPFHMHVVREIHIDD